MDRAAKAFRAIFGRGPTAAALAPGRVEILGNHTDYNGGAVLAAAIDRAICMVGAPSPAPTVRIHSLDLDQRDEFDLPSGPPRRVSASTHGAAWSPIAPTCPTLTHDSARLVQAALLCLCSAGVEVPGLDAVFTGDIPIAAGLSSSAALTVATTLLVRQMSAGAWPADLSSTRLAQLMQQAEQVGLGVRCGLLDPYTSIHGARAALVYLDCATETGTLITFRADAPAIVIADSKSPRTLASSHYNQRRSECETAVRQLARALNRAVDRLCAVTWEEFQRVERDVDDIPRRRARHVIGEHARVQQAIAAVERGDVASLGALMRESHRSSRIDFENSTDRLDLICDVAGRHPACLGSRLCGAGWGGCTVHLVPRGAADEFADWLGCELLDASGAPIAVYVTQASDGARGVAL